MTHSDYLKTKAIDRLDTIVNESDLSYDILMTHLKHKIRAWNTELSGLNGLNPFDLTNDECDRKNYLAHMISYGNELVSNYNKMDDSALFSIERDRKINRILS